MKKKTYIAVMLALATLAATAADDKPAAAPATAATVPNGWAYQPVKALAAPAVKAKKWVRTPIDAFVLAKLEEKGVKPSPEADRAAFIRRATLDAWGLLPTPEEAKAFVNDRSPDAYEKLVDRLLASEHFGERQARRWLDLARYADSTGFQNDNTRPNNWRYRDYVINAFNRDKPYDRFVKEQLAGDELWPDSQEAKIATGYLANTLAFPADVFPKNAVASVWGLASMGSGFGGMCFMALSGWLIARYGYTPVFIGYGIMPVIALSLVLFGIGPLRRDARFGGAAAPGGTG